MSRVRIGGSKHAGSGTKRTRRCYLQNGGESFCSCHFQTGRRWQCVHRAGDRKLDRTKPPPPLDFYGRCIPGRPRCRRSGGVVQAGCRPPAVGGDGREGGRAARCEDRRRRSTAPATPGAAEARLADVDAPVTTNPEWPDTPRRQRGGRSVACRQRGNGDAGATSGRSAPHSGPDSQRPGRPAVPLMDSLQRCCARGSCARPTWPTSRQCANIQVEPTNWVGQTSRSSTMLGVLG